MSGAEAHGQITTTMPVEIVAVRRNWPGRPYVVVRVDGYEERLYNGDRLLVHTHVDIRPT